MPQTEDTDRAVGETGTPVGAFSGEHNATLQCTDRLTLVFFHTYAWTSFGGERF